jgi:UDP-N-acetylglucosamine 1-carboxyvinyltransferase
MTYLALANGTSTIRETIFENRFMHIGELQRMGADIRAEDRTAIIKGVKRLSGAKVKATDLRAGAALWLAGLAAQGETIIYDIEHIERGYENLTEKLSSLGANIKRLA